MPTAVAVVGLIAVIACVACLPARAESDLIDITNAVVRPAAPGSSGPAGVATSLLVDEVERRTRIRWATVARPPTQQATIVLSRRGASGLGSAEPVPPDKPEGYAVKVVARDPVRVAVVGSDDRGVLYGVGKLLRSLLMTRDRVEVPADLSTTSSPAMPLRGHQLGYRPKTNSYDAWTLTMWEQYIRDLAVFGANAVELIPPRSDDAPDSPHFPKPQMETMVGMSKLLDRYGMDVWIWYPALDADYSRPETVEAALKEWGAVLRKLPRVDSIFVPGGDPGHTPPKVLMPFLERVSATLRARHPKAQMWIAPQGFTQAWMDDFLGILRTEPKWLTGVVFGPQLRVSVARLRELVPARYPIRHYPDITHTVRCQFPVQDWDLSFALTEGREPINPRPVDEAAIFRATNAYTVGAITYSEGCNDDVNKAIWSALLWDPNTPVTDVLRDYARYFISPAHAESFAAGLLELEGNWRAPATSERQILATLERFIAMERAASPQDRLNWRFQQALYRAYYDAFVTVRGRAEQSDEDAALSSLRRAAVLGFDRARSEAESALSRSEKDPPGRDLRQRLFELAEALYQSIRMQLSVPKYHAIGAERGANLDAVDAPLNNRVWLRARLTEIAKLPSEPERSAAAAELGSWTDPGLGGFYDEPGNPRRREHVVMGAGFENDPGCYDSVRMGYAGGAQRIVWTRHAETLYDRPLRMRYTGLDDVARYRVRVVYGPDNPARKLRLVTGTGVVVHDWLAKPVPQRPLSFDIPAGAVANGELVLEWSGEPGAGSNGRGCQLSEVWLTRARP